MTDDEWGPWIEHDGKGCPCAGQVVNGVRRSGESAIWIAGTRSVDNLTEEVLGPSSGRKERCRWSWALPENRVSERHHIIRYRVRKPRAMKQIRALLENLPERVDA